MSNRLARVFPRAGATAVEVGISTILDQCYQVQASPNLRAWAPEGDAFVGTGDTF